MFFNKLRVVGSDYNECVSRGSCTTSPEVRALQEVIITFLRQLAFYELKLAENNVSYFENKETIIQGVLTLIVASDYSNEQRLEIVSKIYSKLLYARQEYINYCEEQNLQCEGLTISIKLDASMTINEVIKAGEKSIVARDKVILPQIKNLCEIFLIIIKSVCLNLTNLTDYDKFDDSAYKTLLEAFNLLNYPRTLADKLKNKIDELVNADQVLIEMLEKAQIEKFGEIAKCEVSQSTKAGKAILVSGNNLENLYKVLESTQDLAVDVYTHSDLLIAHSFEKFRKFPNLKGHYGTCIGACILDFSTFPGVILLTKNSYPNLEYLYRGKLFSADELPPKGVVQIKKDDFSPLLEAALEAKGFKKGREVKPITVGYDTEIILNMIDEISGKFNSHEINNLIIIGFSDYSESQKDYFKHLHKLLPEKSFIISFSQHFNADNEFYINLANNLPAAYRVISELFKKVPINSDKVFFFFTRCDSISISNMIALSNMGAKNLNLFQCPPSVLTPNILDALKTLYNISPLTSPTKDVQRLFQ